MSTHAGADAGALFTLDPKRDYPVLDRADGSMSGTATDASTSMRSPASRSSTSAMAGRRSWTRWPPRPRLPFAVGNIFANGPPSISPSRIARLTPGDLDQVHFTWGGSEAVEVALKMARQYHVVRGEPDRAVIISRWTSYHGATLGGLTVGGAKLRRKVYEPMLLDMPHIRPLTATAARGQSPSGLRRRCAAELEPAILEVGPGRVAAFIAEPIMASVGGAIRPQDDTSRWCARSATATACC